MLYKPVKSGGEPMANTDPRFDPGVVLGIREVSDEVILFDPQKGNSLQWARTMKRRPAEEQ